MGREITDIRIQEQGRVLEVRTNDGAGARLAVKEFLSRPSVTGGPASAPRLVEATLESDGVRLRLAHGETWRRPARYLAETAGLVPLDGKDRSADLLMLGADWGLIDVDAGHGHTAQWELRQDLGIAVRSGRILDLGPSSEIQSQYLRSPDGLAPRILDARGLGVTPGLIDPHTHLVFAGDRSREFAMRAVGAGYLEIAAAGGGIVSTVTATRQASDEELLSLAASRLARIAGWGVTTLEAKSGYSLDMEGELRILDLLQRLDESGPIDIRSTLLAAHVVPPEFRERRQEYVQLIMDEILPRVAQQGLASSCDVFCEEGAFTIEETRAILTRAKDLGLGLRVHAEQFTDSGAAALAAELGAWSADHLEAAGEATIAALAASHTVAVLLPGAALTVADKFPDARRLIDAGVTVALGTDFNPGTSMTESLPLMMSLACTQMGMTVPEAWAAVTSHAAQALGLTDRGRLVKGAKADMALFAAPGPESVPYEMGRNLLAGLVKAGQPIVP